jgi:hypothetical protein
MLEGIVESARSVAVPVNGRRNAKATVIVTVEALSCIMTWIPFAVDGSWRL